MPLLAVHHLLRDLDAAVTERIQLLVRRRFFEGKRVPAFQGFADQAVRRLTLLDSADALEDLAGLPGNRLEALQGDRAAQHSIRINAQWRICFRWTANGPHDVEIVDYH